MKMRFSFIAFLLLISLSVKAQEEEKAVRQAFEDYKSAILKDKGEQAVNYVDSRTISYYGKIIDLVRTADSATVAALPLMDKMMVLIIRHRAPREEILALDGRGLVVYSIKMGMVGKASVASNSIGEVKVKDNFATGEFLNHEQKTPYDFHFYKEDGQWKIDLTSIFPASEKMFKKMIDESGEKELDVIFTMLERLTGEKVKEEIWDPVK